MKRYFVVGEKGSSFRLEIPKASGDVEESIKSGELDEKISFLKTKRKNFNVGKLPEDIYLKNDIINALLHTLGDEVVKERKLESTYISVAAGSDNLQIVRNFSGKKGLIILGYQEVDDNIIDSDRLEIFNVISDKILTTEQEVLVKDVLFPNKIIGFFVFNADSKDCFFVVNPWLVEKLRRIRDFENGKLDIEKKFVELQKTLLYSSRIPVDQEDFDIYNEILGNKGNVYEYERRITEKKEKKLVNTNYTKPNVPFFKCLDN